MRLSSRAEYGMRVMVELAAAHGCGPLSLAQIARSEGLSLSYLEQLIGTLRRSGLVGSVRGARGGYTLARPPDAIRVGDVVRSLEGPIEPVNCLAEGERASICKRQASCAARAMWECLRDSITETLDSVTLADLIAGRVGKVVIQMPASPVGLNTGNTSSNLPASAPGDRTGDSNG